MKILYVKRVFSILIALVFILNLRRDTSARLLAPLQTENM